MPIYVSMLRGINVGGHKKMKMDQLRASIETLGLEQVKTYIQSGNVVFKTGKISPSALSKRIEEKLLGEFGFSVSVVSRTIDEMSRAIANNPFLRERGIDAEKLHVTFLSEAPAASARKKLEALTAAPDQSRCLGKELYLYLPNGVAESRLMKTPLDRLLSVVTTTRNWRTVNALHQMCLDCR
ncbi:MAG: DUF1697 domain-containing protein [Candidatus Sulfotelmatobacter sp.]